jgi:hypothetical protein
MSTLSLRNLDGRARPQPDVECRICGKTVKLLRQLQYEGKHTLGCAECYEKSRQTRHKPILAPLPVVPEQLAEREQVSAELARTFFNLQRLALPPGEAISVTMPVEQPRAINATFVLDNAMPRVLSFEDAYQARVNVVKRGLPTLHRRGQAQAWEAAA